MKIVVRWRPFVLFGITLLGLALRLYGLNWDQGNSFHPDERQIMFHVTSVAWPSSFAQFLNPAMSPLNPHFFAYGSFPIYLLAIIGHVLARFFPYLGTFFGFTLVGRVVSALFDSGTILLTGWLGLLLTPDSRPGKPVAWSVAFLAAVLVAFTPFQLQLAHFYTVDTLLLFFVILTVLACIALVDTDKPVRWSLIAGIGYGLAMATKISAAPLAVPILIALLMRWHRHDLYSTLVSLLTMILVTLVFFVGTQPYFLLDFANYYQQVVEQGDLARGLLDYPYVRQFAGTTPYLYEAQNMIVWGLGLFLGIAAVAGLLWQLWRVWKRRADTWLIVLSWILIYALIVGDFYVKFMRYMLPLYPFFTLLASTLLIAMISRFIGGGSDSSRSFVPPDLTKLATTNRRDESLPTKQLFGKNIIAYLPMLALIIVVGGTIFQGLALLNVYSQPNTRVQASEWMYSHIKPGSVITYEQWDDPLPVTVGNNSPSIYNQLTYTENGQPTTGLDLYGDDTTAKAQLLAHLLPQINVLTMASDRLDKSIPRLPARYPLTIRYYQLLFSGQLGFHLAAQFVNRPNLLGITLDDSNADESYSVFDHPHVRIFVRDTPYPYTEDQLFQKLIAGVQLPPLGAGLSGAQRSLLLTPQQISDDQQSPPFGVQFPANSLANALPPLFWWLAILLLGWCVYPLLFFALPTLAERGYIFSKLLGMLLFAYLGWLLASLHLLPFEQLSLAFVAIALALVGIATGFAQRNSLFAFIQQKRLLLLLAEIMFTLAFLFFVGIRALNPDLWNVYIGGEKPMEFAFLNAILRSPYMPPLDPWFSGGYINYYYYGYVIFAALIKLTGIIPTTAFNLTLPTLFALTFSGATIIVYSFTRRIPFALLGGYFTAMIGNFNGFMQFKGQLLALLAHLPVPTFNYWQSSRVIPFTINEFPFWSFLFADLHPHVMDMPIAICMLGLLAALILSPKNADTSVPTVYQRRALYLVLAFVFGTIACVNPWDMPVYAILLLTIMLVQMLQTPQKWNVALLISLAMRVVTALCIMVFGYLCYLPFYSSYQELYVNGIGRVTSGTNLGDFLTISSLWLFLAVSFFGVELYRRFSGTITQRIQKNLVIVLCVLAGIALLLLGLKTLLFALILLGAFLFVLVMLNQFGIIVGTDSSRPVVALSVDKPGRDKLVPPMIEGVETGRDESAPTMVANVRVASLNYTYILLLMALCISLGLELVYIRDFLDGGAYERMNTVFKFGIQSWFCFALGGALAVPYLWKTLQGVTRQVWTVLLVALVLCCSTFLLEGPAARIQDHQTWAVTQPPAVSANYTPTLDGFAFVRSWYPQDAQAITWLNAHISGSPVILEADAPVSYQWYSRVSVYTGLPDVLGWPDHVGEQRYSDQELNRLTDIGIIYTTTDSTEALILLHYYHVRYIYVGPLERQTYAQKSMAGLNKFNQMVGSSLRVVYNTNGVTIYEVL